MTFSCLWARASGGAQRRNSRSSCSIVQVRIEKSRRISTSQKEALDTSGTANVVSSAAVGWAKQSVSIKLSELPEVDHEIQKIRDETSVTPDMEFETVTIEGAVRAFGDHRWVHLACHGAQHAKRPFESWFAMGDGKLTVSSKNATRIPSLDSCLCATRSWGTGRLRMRCPIAAVMQFAGFDGVIGTLWRVDDAVAHQVVTRVYKEMFKRPVIDFGRAAAALNVAVVESAGEVWLEKRIVFVHIGI